MKLLTFVLITALVHGPLSPFLPTAYEATLMYYARLLPLPTLALAGTLAASVAEVVNYRLVDWAAALPALARHRERKLVRWTVDAFLRAPFWTTVFVIFSPLPDTAVRILAPLGRYPVLKYVAATAVGRLPRFLLIAGLGLVVPIPQWVLVAAGVAFLAAAAVRRWWPVMVAWVRRAPPAGDLTPP